MTGLYLHIPFCKSRCIYCGFYSTTLSGLRQAYVNAVGKEMQMRSTEDRIATIYLGGGTPSQLSTKQLQQMFDNIYNIYNVDEDAEVTMECNPDDVTEDFCKDLKDLPVNRVSMGAQTFNDDRLRFLHRRHTAEEVGMAVGRLRGIGINNISIDLMFGFPDETITDWQSDIDAAIALGVEHISAYSLMYEEGTMLYEQIQNPPHSSQKEGTPSIHPISDELERQMYEMLIDCLEAAGYEHYEISNFAKPSLRSRHNSSYWNNIPYIGLGAAAHSYDGTSRQWNVSDIREYIGSIEKGAIPCEREDLNDDTQYNDLVTTALRTREGIDLEKLSNKYREYLLCNAKTALRNGLLCIEDQHIRLTRKGLFVSDDVMSDLIWV